MTEFKTYISLAEKEQPTQSDGRRQEKTANHNIALLRFALALSQDLSVVDKDLLGLVYCILTDGQEEFDM